MLLVLMAVAGNASGANITNGANGAGNPGDANGAEPCCAVPAPSLSLQSRSPAL